MKTVCHIFPVGWNWSANPTPVKGQGNYVRHYWALVQELYAKGQNLSTCTDTFSICHQSHIEKRHLKKDEKRYLENHRFEEATFNKSLANNRIKTVNVYGTPNVMEIERREDEIPNVINASPRIIIVDLLKSEAHDRKQWSYKTRECQPLIVKRTRRVISTNKLNSPHDSPMKMEKAQTGRVLTDIRSNRSVIVLTETPNDFRKRRASGYETGLLELMTTRPSSVSSGVTCLVGVPL